MMVNKYMHLLFLDSGNYDENNFRLEGLRGNIVLCKGKIKEDDGIIWGMKRATCLKAHYSDEEIRKDALVNSMKPIKNGEVIMICDLQTERIGFYRTEIIGNYSDCSEFHPICDIMGEDL